jgi:hypothetical protein
MSGRRIGENGSSSLANSENPQRIRPSDGPEVTLRAAAGIELNSLSPSVVGRYLLTDAGGPKARERWAPVINALGSATPAAQALTTPLMVSLARIIYNPRPGEMMERLHDPAEICEVSLSDRAAVETPLLDAFIPAAYRDLHGDPSAVQRAQRWLGFIAAYLDQPHPLRFWQVAWQGRSARQGLGSGRQQVPVQLMSDVDVPMPQEAG